MIVVYYHTSAEYATDYNLIIQNLLEGYDPGTEETLVVTSGEMLQQLWSLIPQWYREQWLLHCRVVVVSERLALQARELGWQEIQVADSADNDALLRALQ